MKTSFFQVFHLIIETQKTSLDDKKNIDFSSLVIEKMKL